MDEYIKREDAKTAIKEYALRAYDIDLEDAKQFAGSSLAENYCEGLYEATEILDDIPASNATEVVRCKDCEYCHISTDPKTLISVQVCGYVGYNPVQSSQVSDNDYCSHGERRLESGT